jgi:hypothetical protein
MKKKLLFSAMLVCLLALGLTGCGDKDSGDSSSPGGGGSIPTELVGSWGKQVNPFITVFKINSDGSGIWGDPDLGGTSCSWTVNGNRLTLHFSGQEGSIDWSVSNNRLTLSGTASGQLASLWAGPTQSSPLDKKPN